MGTIGFSSGRQQDTVASHCEQFELLSQYESLREENMMAVFIIGLDDQIKAELLVHP